MKKSIAYRQAEVMKRLGLKRVDPPVYPSWKEAAHWDHPLGARVLILKTEFVSARKVLALAMANYFEKRLIKQEAIAPREIAKERKRNSDLLDKFLGRKYEQT